MTIRLVRGDITKLDVDAIVISRGVYRYPLDEAAAIAVNEALAALATHDRPETVLFCCLNEDVATAFARALAT